MISRCAALLTPPALLVISALLLGCGGTSEVVPDSGVKVEEADAKKSTANCSLAASLGTDFNMVEASGNGYVENPLDIEVIAKISDTSSLFFTSYNSETVPLGKQEMEGQWLDANCIFCIFLNSVDLEAQKEHLWFPTSGEIEITSVKDNFVMTGTNLKFQHVSFVGNTLNVEPAEDGCVTEIPSLQINTPMHVGNQ